MKDIDEAQLTQPIAGAKNPPAYILCHLAMVNDMGLAMLGRPNECPAGWAEVFGPGKQPQDVSFAYPPKAELLAIVQRGQKALCEAARGAAAEAMLQPHGLAMFAGSPIETKGDIVALLLTAHLSFHLGQLSVMRRQLGFAPVF